MRDFAEHGDLLRRGLLNQHRDLWMIEKTACAVAVCNRRGGIGCRKTRDANWTDKWKRDGSRILDAEFAVEVVLAEDMHEKQVSGPNHETFRSLLRNGWECADQQQKETMRPDSHKSLLHSRNSHGTRRSAARHR